MDDKNRANELVTKPPGDAPSHHVDSEKPISKAGAACDRDRLTEDGFGKAKKSPIPRMSPFEFVSLIFSGLTFGMLVVTATVYYCQLREMEKTSKAAYDAIETSRDIAKTQLRAYVSIEHPADEKDDGFPQVFQVGLVNAGQTPAKNVRASANWWYFDKKNAAIPPNFTYPLTTDNVGSTFTLRSQGRQTIAFPLLPCNDAARTPFPVFLDRATKRRLPYIIMELFTMKTFLGSLTLQISVCSICQRQKEKFGRR